MAGFSGTNSNSFVTQSESEVGQPIDEWDLASDFQLAEDDALFDTWLAEDEEEDYDLTVTNNYDAYLDIVEDGSLWRYL
ncbi:hypothetical protein K493DRAFT_318349 [Basidiobolus meristosporus CBS 931.73]|uniref:Uncharacterized protein n=1 Tax=Basidiobolus meristosporus CBS 931.73 TaxID=1314790 RepID=A0A1Y1XVY3_9FUNG|nr:hypothetical protein K493DRAFT_321109 [Basidiobolus meristosporus CBS 931.73]ORX89883.1 hypothetical protein K493DRAFT_318349 [Basidiobolus meristosporus CBS 931.73]|eukprot:ORX79031.1 hypothetical protein K493DRAFT_321109 [Basidiobolus meristosporus CBS 931.73]